MAIKEKYLPLGTVVKLKNGDAELMIISYRISTDGNIYKNKVKIENKDYVFDYAACIYPLGVLRSDQMIAFNHDQIAEVLFEGYKTESLKEIIEILKEEEAASKNDKTIDEDSQEEDK